ncbi:hypothetical protein [Streptomyces boncukensis]|uniref:Lipase n=1 Tax=Streptomyces boncukensis TaxID=2711219 RepID=A0A6G4WXY6_9ACTN|nr:hypothetical protein [Streptomyces boncukensis]NGO69722.1 hypothetical protein [Streptomyces boncukensis]
MDARTDVSYEPWATERAPLPGPGALAEALPEGVLLAPPAYPDRPAPPPDERWELAPAWGRARGCAAVHHAHGRRALERPLVLADGFGYGPSDLAGLYAHLHTLLDPLRAAGTDVVLLGFAERHAALDANAAVAVSCLRKVIARQAGRAGFEPLTVGGVGTGGLATRYALARMEHEGEEHRAGRYVSYDTPHNGAVLPLVLQQTAHVLEALDPRPGAAQAALVRSPAAQQTLWGWVPDAEYAGPVATASPLRARFLAELRRVGWFPRTPRRLGVANGSGTGAGRDVPPGTQVFDWSELAGCLQATVRTQPRLGEGRFAGRIRALDIWRSSTTSGVPAFDGAPGGTLESYGLLADALGAKIANAALRRCCFVPAVSAVALDHDPVAWPVDLYADLSALPPGSAELDEFRCDTENSPHGAVRPHLVAWLLDRLA